MAKNKTLNAAKDAKHDEYYTRYEDIQTELNHYEKHFKGKTVLCNCDDPFESNFCKFFLKNFNYLGLKRLICTSYATSPVVGTMFDLFDDNEAAVKKGNGYVMDVTEVPMANGRGVSDADIERLLTSKKRGVKKLKGDGDFRSEECIEYLKQADIVVTNPPFSLLIEYFMQLFKYDKKFLIIGNPNALHYKEIFPLVKANKIWVGYKSMSADMLFDVTPEFADWLVKNKKQGSGYRIIDGVIKGRAQAIWFTNLDIDKRHEDLVLYKRFNADEYPKYYNYDGIDVGKVSEIPVDYFGDIGVPDSFLEYYNPDQFEIIGMGTDVPKTKEHISYKNKNLITYEIDGKIVWSTEYSVSERKAGNSLRLDENGKPGRLPYSRLIIRRKQHHENRTAQH